MLREISPRHAYMTSLKILTTLLLTAVLVAWFFPLTLSVMTSLKSNAEVVEAPLALPQHPTLDAFVQTWKSLRFSRLLLNSCMISLGGTALAILIAVFPAYALSRFAIPGRLAIFILLLSGMMVPQQAVVVPLYEELRLFGLLNKPTGLIVLHGVYNFPFIMLVLRGFMVSIPRELENAARVDGCSDIGVLRHVVLPSMVPAVAVAGTLTVINIWNELFFAMIFLNSSDWFPVSVGLTMVKQGRYFSSWNTPAAAMLMSELPIILLYILAYRYIREGVYAGAVKG